MKDKANCHYLSQNIYHLIMIIRNIFVYCMCDEIRQIWGFLNQEAQSYNSVDSSFNQALPLG